MSTDFSKKKISKIRCPDGCKCIVLSVCPETGYYMVGPPPPHMMNLCVNRGTKVSRWLTALDFYLLSVTRCE